MCEPGKPCNTFNAEAALAKAMEYMTDNRDAIKSQFERTYESHPALKSAKVQAAINDKPNGAAKLKDLCEQFYLAGIMDLIIHGSDVRIDGEPVHEEEDEGDAMAGLEKLSDLVNALVAAKKHFTQQPTTIQRVRDFDENDINSLEIPEVPEGYQMDKAHVVNGKTGKSIEVDIKGMTPDQVREAIAKVMKANV